MVIDITYNGNSIASLEDGKTAIIKCAGKKMAGDLTITAPEVTPESFFNIAYGDTEPTDTSKLWIKTNEPEAVQVVPKVVGGECEISTLSATLPTAAEDIAAAAVGTKVYLFGGYGGSCLNTINVFDTKSSTISTLSATLPTATDSIAAAAVGTKVYLFGGRYYSGGSEKFLNTINVFDTETNTISTLSATLPKAAMSIEAAAVGTKVYLFGGYGGSCLNTINVFDTKSSTISTLSAKLPTAAMSIAAAAVGTKVYLFGGTNSSWSSIDTINVFDTETNTISTLSAKLPTAATNIAAAAVGTKVYLFGGQGSSFLNTINVFDTKSSTISTLSATLPKAARGIAAAAVGTKVYLFGGYPYLYTINEFALVYALTANNMLIEASINKNLFNLLPNVELGVNAVYLGNADGEAETVAAALYVNGAWAEI